MEAHDQAMVIVSKRLQDLYARREAFRVYHGSTNSTRAIQKDGKQIIDTSDLNHVLAIDKAKMTALVEPNMPMDKFVEAALRNGLVPLVVMEFPGITVGGGFSGPGRHGPFDSTVNWIEIVTPDGEIRRASKTEDPDLFWGAASAFGTIGIVTLLEVRLQDATQYLQEQVADTSVEFVDGIVFSPSRSVICAGRLVDTLPSGTSPRRYLGRRDPWFYLDVQKRAAGSPSPVVDYVPLEDYLFRWDRGGFWVARYPYRYFFTPFNRITRYALDTFMHAHVMYHPKFAVIQDVGVPFDAVESFYEWLHQILHIYPLWLCPIRVRRYTPDAAHGLHADFADATKTPEVMLNFGVWGPGPNNYDELVRLNRLTEHKVHELGGAKTLYAQAYYTEEEFYAINAHSRVCTVSIRLGVEGTTFCKRRARFLAKITLFVAMVITSYFFIVGYIFINDTQRFGFLFFLG
ncbi:hypothetical protein RRF57_003295 [Xylaria bambusicola]|uniref:Delta(24)-sterol reductase n=1 Tax=Xylaria bambusicola TaxID=326684 RepID=A0AAN7U8K9_9PEZI